MLEDGRSALLQTSRRSECPDPSLFRTFKCGHPAITAQWRLQVTHEAKLFKSFSFISQTFPAHLLVIKWSGATDEQKGLSLSALTHSTPPCPFECRRVPAWAASSSICPFSMHSLFPDKARTKYQQGSYLFNYLCCLWLIIWCDNSAFVMLFTCRRWLTAPLLNSKANSCCHDCLATGWWWMSTRDGWPQ